jgi:hypothetical protein
MYENPPPWSPLPGARRIFYSLADFYLVLRYERKIQKKGSMFLVRTGHVFKSYSNPVHLFLNDLRLRS